MNNKDIDELIAISYFDDADLSIKEHCDIYFTIQKEIIDILNKYNIKWTITDTKSYNDKDKEIERLNNIINTTSTLLKHERYNYHDKPVAKGIQVDDVLSAAIFTCDLAINVLENKYINEWDKKYLENALKEGK